ncbi:MAG TPA: helix-turn-helix domain-containing protein [Azospirillum sp.]|nr:helix-turn-helix domain-containing protein [Azospirillum sp.]
MSADTHRKLSSREAAARIGISPSALSKWRRRRFGPEFIRINSRLVRYDAETVDAWLAAQRVPASSGAV